MKVFYTVFKNMRGIMIFVEETKTIAQEKLDKHNNNVAVAYKTEKTLIEIQGAIMNKLSRQQIFNIAVNGLLFQGIPSWDNEKKVCRYRYNDCKCGMGQLIPFNLYSPALEGILPDSAMFRGRNILNQFEDDTMFGYGPTNTLTLSFINAIQYDLHDLYCWQYLGSKDSAKAKPGPKPAFIDWLKKAVIEFAFKHNLVINDIDFSLSDLS